MDSQPAVCRAAFTLVELLVVIAIIGMLVAILLPAVNSVRESGRLVTCKNNLRQQAMGLRGYAQQFPEQLPAMWQKGKNKPWENFSWRVALLPFLEEDARYDRIDQTTMPLDARNADAATTISAFVCPSSPGSPRVIRELGPNKDLQLGATDYVAVFDIGSSLPPGLQSGAWFGGRAPDAFPFDHSSATGPSSPTEGDEMRVDPDSYSAEIRKKPSTFRLVRDGLSNTVLLVEQAGKPTRLFSSSTIDFELSPNNFQELPTEGAWLTSEYASFSATAINQDNHGGAYSFHSGASVVMCDASVHFWPTDIDNKVMVALLTREGSEIVAAGDW